MNKSTESIWHPIIWSCCPLLPLMSLRYEHPHVSVLPLLSGFIQHQKSVKKTCVCMCECTFVAPLFVCVSLCLNVLVYMMCVVHLLLANANGQIMINWLHGFV